MKWLKNISLIFPLYFVLLAIAPLLIGLTIEAELVNSRYFLINFVWLLLFTIPFALTQKRIWIKIGLIFFFILGLVEISHWCIVKAPLNATNILVVANSNFAEASEFMDTKFSYRLLYLLPFIGIFMLAWSRPKQISSIQPKWFIWLFAVVAIGFIAENALNQRLVRKGVPHTLKVGIQLADQIAVYQEIFKTNDPKNVATENEAKTSTNLAVLIIGESESRRHMSLYGYHRNTTPLLRQRKDIVAFDNVITPFSNTLSCVLSSISEGDIYTYDSLGTYVDILDVFHSSGYKTFWLSNQSLTGIWENLISHTAKKADVTKFINTAGSTSFEATYVKSYDEGLFAPLKEALNDTAANKLIVLHLMGNHTSYSKRYPEKFKKFEGEGEVDGTQAHYDNSVLYNDFVVNEFFNMVNEHSNQKNISATAVYLSDHGENVYDENGNCGHDYALTIPKSNVEIPFIVWMSDNYKNLYGLNDSIAQSRSSSSFMSDDLFYSFLDLNHLKYAGYKSERSLFSEDFNASRQRILENEEDYDLK